MRKIDRAKRLIRKHSRLFMCPLCGAPVSFNEANSLICSTGHCFDLSKYGYIHLLPRPVKPAKYDKAMFESRHVICRSGFFSELVEQIRDIVRNGIGNTHKRINVLDAGCGEGSHLADLVKGLGLTDAEVLGVGMDISKYGIRIASREYPGLIWCVADLAQSPFMDQQFDVILNIFSPSNYSEFARMLHDDEVLIKIVPGRDYLKELRNIFYGQTDKQSYSNERVVTHFRQHFRLVDTRQIRYSRRLNPTDLKHLINMTPLSWGTTEKNIQRVLQMGISSVTIDVTMVVGKKG